MAGCAEVDLRIAARGIKTMVPDQTAGTGKKSLGWRSMTDIAADIGCGSRIIIIKWIQLPDPIFVQSWQALRRMAGNAAGQHFRMSQSDINGCGRHDVTAHTYRVKADNPPGR
jgi:hypothetical protein